MALLGSEDINVFFGYQHINQKGVAWWFSGWKTEKATSTRAEEYASGGELFDYIVQHQRVPEQQACIFFHQIIAGAGEEIDK